MGASKELTEKQERFCNYYLDTGIMSEAYRMAYDTSNMKPETVHRSAYSLMQNPKIYARIAEIEGQRAEE